MSLTRFGRYPLALSMLWSLLLLTVIYRAGLSFGWINTHDTGLMHYMAWLMDVHGYIPYRDVLDTSFPGSFLIHLWSGKLFGFDSTGFRIADIFLLCTLLAFTWCLLRPAGPLVAFSAVCIYALHYYSNHTSMHFQRDYLALLPICAGLLLVRYSPQRPITALLLSGVCFGFTAAIKPQLAAGVTVALLYSVVICQHPVFSPKVLLRQGLIMAAGLFTSLLAITLWLHQIHAWPAFMDMAQGYLPIYLLPKESYMFQSSWSSFMYFLSREGLDACIKLFTGSLIYLVPALSGCLWGWINARHTTQKWLVLVLLAMMLAGLLSNFMGFRLWAYHAMPFAFFALLAGALIFQVPGAPLHPWQTVCLWCGRLLFIIALFLNHSLPTHLNFKGETEGNAYQKNAAEHLVQFMRTYATNHSLDLSQEYAQPITWNSVGPILPVLQNLALRIPTRFPECWVCHHKPADDTRANIYRQELLTALQANPPRFIFTDRFYRKLSASNPTSPFPALAQFVETHYQIIYQTDYLLVYERR